MTLPTDLMTIPSAVAIGSTATLGVLALTFTESDPLMLIAALSALVLTAGGVIVNIIVAWRTSAKVDANTKVTEETAKKADVIEGHVNSAATRDAAIIASMEKQNMMLRETVAKLEQIAALRDQAQAINTAHPVVTGHLTGGTTGGGGGESLHNIDKNTKAIEKNTASTDAKVDDLKGGAQ